jgi:HK97 family phage major capsid protein
LQAGSQTISYTQGAAGGFLIPLDYEKIVFAALAQTDPLFSPGVCRFTMADTPTLQPQQISGWDLSSITASQINETSQQTAGNVPNVLGRVLRGSITYRVSLAASFEAEQDIPGTMSKLAMAMGIGFARKLGQDAINGNGTTQPQGIVTPLTSIYTTANSGKIVADDLTAIYFAVNRIYRSSALCSWLVSDSTYRRIREAVDLNGRPLINMVDDRETILGKPVYICPSLPFAGTQGSPSVTTNSTIVFGDLSHFFVRCSKATLQRALNTTIADISHGQALYVARIRMDSAVFDPSVNNSAPPIVIATVLA